MITNVGKIMKLKLDFFFFQSFKANLYRGLLIRVTCIGVLVEPSVAAVLQSG